MLRPLAGIGLVAILTVLGAVGLYRLRAEDPPPPPPATAGQLPADLTPDRLALIAVDPGHPDHERVEALVRLARQWPEALVEPVTSAIRQLLSTVADARLRAQLAALSF